MTQITLTRPDDMHLHLRDGAAMRSVLPHSAARFGRAVVMPNLRPPITTTAMAIEYRDRIIAALPAGDRREALRRVDANVRADLQAIAERRSRQQPVVREAASRAYNEFLRANRVEDGTASYARALRLILASPVYDAMGEVRRDRRPPA